MDPDIDCTPSQTSTTVSIRSGVGASASAASILSGQLSTAVSTSVSKENELESASTLSGQISTADCILTTDSTPIPAQNSTAVKGNPGQVPSTAVKNQEKKQFRQIFF